MGCGLDRVVIRLTVAQAHPDAVVPNQGPLVPWTAGFVGPKEDDNIPPEVSDLAGCRIITSKAIRDSGARVLESCRPQL
jgi:hypothetical protein